MFICGMFWRGIVGCGKDDVVDFGLGTSFFFARERLVEVFLKKKKKNNEYMDNRQTVDKQWTKQPIKNIQQPTTNNQQPTTYNLQPTT